MMDSLLVSKLTATDVDSVKALEMESGLSSWSLGDYINLFSEEDSVCLKAEEITAESILTIGFVVSKLMLGDEKKAVLDTENSAEIYNVCVAKEFRNSGIGGELLRNLFELFRERKVKKVWLEVRESNEVAIAFYERQGFKVLHNRKDYYSKPTENAIVMSVTLKI